MSFEDILKKILKKIRTWLTSLYYTQSEAKKNIMQEKNRENAAKNYFPSK